MTTYEFENVRCTKMTEKAIYVEAPDLDPLPCKRGDLDRCWLPRRAIHPDSEVFSTAVGEDVGKLVVHGWFLTKQEVEPDGPPEWYSPTPPRGREVPPPPILQNRPLRPPGRR
jgi:hypothetical protein